MPSPGAEAEPATDAQGVAQRLDIHRLLQQLGLGHYVSISRHLEAQSARTGHLFLRLRSAAGGPPLLLKQRHGYLGEREFRLHIALHRHLLQHGGPVTGIPPSLAPRLPLALPDGRQVELQEWFPGRPPDLDSARDLERLGAVLAAFHRAARSFPWPRDPDVHREPRERFAKAQFYRSYLEGALGGEGAGWTDALYRHLEEARRSLAEREARLGPQPRQVLHGDPVPSNLLLSSDGAGVLIDLDDAHLGSCSADLAWLLTLSAAFLPAPSTPSGWRLHERWQEETIAAILASYAAGGGSLEAVDPEWLRPWLVASVVCAVTDCFLEGRRSLEDLEVFHRQACQSLERIAEIPGLELTPP